MRDAMDMGARAQVVGVGAQTAIGRTAPASAAAARAGIARFVEHERFLDRRRQPVVVASASWLPADLDVSQRLLALALPAAREALRGLQAGLPPAGARLLLSLGLPAHRPGLRDDIGTTLPGALADLLRRDLPGVLRLEGAEVSVSGHSAGLRAIERGWRRILSGETDLCLAGGVDSYLDEETIRWLEGCGQLHSTANAWGFIPGEAAGFCLLAGPQIAGRCGGDPLAAVIAVGTGREENLIKTRTVCTGEGLTAAFKAALGALPLGARVDHVIADLNGEPYRADEFSFAMVRARRNLADPGGFRTPADCWGDVGAASGPLFVALATEAGRGGYARGPHTLLCTSSEPGERAAAVFHVPPCPREV